MIQPSQRLGSLAPSFAFVVLVLLVMTAPGCTLDLPTNDPVGLDGGSGGTGGTGGSAGSAGSAGSGGTSSGVARGSALGSLTFDQASALCDWTNQKQGGYGRSVACSSGTLQSTSSSTASCVSKTLGLGGQCPVLTVANIEDCATATGPDLCLLESAAACSPIRSCAM